jgi:phenylalanyl-tRNA synthetase alpha subunit
MSKNRRARSHSPPNMAEPLRRAGYIVPKRSGDFGRAFLKFTKPNAEVDLPWVNSDGRERWIDVGGCEMADHNVFEAVGIERLAIRKYSITDIRFLIGNDLRFLERF